MKAVAHDYDIVDFSIFPSLVESFSGHMRSWI